MENQEPNIDQVLVEVVQPLLQKYVRDRTAYITKFSTEPMKHEGAGGNRLYRAKVSWKARDHDNSADWVIKHWRSGGPTGVYMGVILPVEALAWRCGFLQPEVLPEGIIVPYVGVHPDEDGDGAWIVMDDISDELSVFRSTESLAEKLEQARFILDRLACFHVYWEQPEQISILKERSWLLTQEQYLWFLADVYAGWLGQQPRKVKTLPAHPFREVLRKSILVFLDWLPESDRRLWQEHMCNREALVEAFTDLPQTLFHGDLAWNNIGLRWERDRKDVFLVDWEFIGIGSPALDVSRFINVTLELRGNISYGTESLPDYYFDRYVERGGTRLDRKGWERSYDLAFLWGNLWALPYWAGVSLGMSAQVPDNRLRDVEMIKQKIKQTTETLRKRLC